MHFRRLGVCALAAVVGGLGLGTAAQAATTTLTPGADTYVRSDQPTTNFGTSTSLRVDGSPLIRSYLRFNVAGLTGTVTRTTLRVYATSPQSTGIDVHAVADTSWSEIALTDANAPALGAKLGASGPATTGAWLSVDVTSAVAGDGVYGFGLATTNATALGLASRESSTRPELVVESAPGPDPVIAAAGDIACDPAHPNFNGGLGANGDCMQKRVSDLGSSGVAVGR